MINNETFYIDKIDNVYDFWDSDSKLPKILKKILGFFYLITNKICVKKIKFETLDNLSNIEDVKILLLPVKDLDNIKHKKLERILKNLLKKINEYPVENVVLSEEIENFDMIKDYLSNYNILNGRWLFKYVIKEILDYIFSIQKTDLEKVEVSILVNDNSDTNIEIIKNLAIKCKVLNVVTNNIKCFDFLEKYLADNYGVIINLTTNLKKGMVNSSVVLNFDFPIDVLNKCTFSKYALIINFKDNLKILSKSFEGVNINFYKILLPIKYRKIADLMYRFKEEALYESFIFSRRRYDFIRKQIINDKLKIKFLLGANGKIKVDEFSRVKNFYVDSKRRKFDKRLDKIQY